VEDAELQGVVVLGAQAVGFEDELVEVARLELQGRGEPVAEGGVEPVLVEDIAGDAWAPAGEHFVVHGKEHRAAQGHGGCGAVPHPVAQHVA
jgi:hypothetical protein